ncbi:MAG: CRISPR-associated protein Cas4 [Prolixibacteraceae bacterium]|jgi:CRISPR-associated exonuclease Cas4|nr:CRISPR-associated protein Cas4 [Prolixibacteraceae bacterium]
MYSDDDLLMLSGIQHIAFCERQWALIHIEQQWAENMRTVEGNHMHERVDDPFAGEVRGSVITLRSVSLVSYRLGLYGVADVVEFIRSENGEGIGLEGYPGKWQPVPVEYKRGKPKPDERDEVQLCAQAICLEEIYNATDDFNLIISTGYLFYGETRHRHEVIFSQELRNRVESYARRMHELFETGTTPLAIYKTHCKACSLVELCNPKAFCNPRKVNDYLENALETD